MSMMATVYVHQIGQIEVEQTSNLLANIEPHVYSRKFTFRSKNGDTTFEVCAFGDSESSLGIIEKEAA